MTFFIIRRLLYYIFGILVSLPLFAQEWNPIILMCFYVGIVEYGFGQAREHYLFKQQEYQNLYKYRDRVNLDPTAKGAWNDKRHLVWYGVLFYLFMVYGILADTDSYSFFFPALITWGVLCVIHYFIFAPKLVYYGELQDRRRFHEDVSQEEREQKIVDTIVTELDKKRSSRNNLSSRRRPIPPYTNRQKNINN